MKRSSAFTLIEMLVVIATVGVLVGIMVPTLASVRRQAMRAVCASNLRQLGLASNMYLDDNNDRYWRYYSTVAGGRLWWFGFEAGGPQASTVPHRPLDITRSALAPYLTSLSDRLQCPAFPYHDPGYFPKYVSHSASLGFNQHLAGDSRQEYNGRETEVFIFVDGIHFDQPEKFNEAHYVRSNTNTGMLSGYAHFRHVNVAQMVMMDGHVEAQPLQGVAHQTVGGGAAGNLVAADGSDAIYGK